MKHPEPGDHVTVQDSILGELSGIVIDLLSSQFTYFTDGGTVRFAFYNDDWRIS